MEIKYIFLQTKFSEYQIIRNETSENQYSVTYIFLNLISTWNKLFLPSNAKNGYRKLNMFCVSISIKHVYVEHILECCFERRRRYSKHVDQSTISDWLQSLHVQCDKCKRCQQWRFTCLGWNWTVLFRVCSIFCINSVLFF